jgi:DNA-binding NtrC family response regulator
MQVIEEGKVPVRAVVTDLSMPGQSGIELAQWLAARGEMPCVLMSGLYRDPEEMRRTRGVVEYLEKPFDLDTFAAAIRACFTDARSSTRQ